MVSDDIAPGAVQISTGAWFDPAPGRNDTPLCLEGNPNVLTSDRPTSRLTQAPAPLSALVEVERVEGRGAAQIRHDAARRLEHRGGRRWKTQLETSPTTTSNPLDGREAGQGDIVLFLHGMPGSRTSWDRQIAAMSRRYRCVSWDMPGYGVSPAIDPGSGFPVVLDILSRFVDERLSGQKVHLVGLSLGGMIAMHAAAGRAPYLRSIAVLDASPLLRFRRRVGCSGVCARCPGCTGPGPFDRGVRGRDRALAHDRALPATAHRGGRRFHGEGKRRTASNLPPG